VRSEPLPAVLAVGVLAAIAVAGGTAAQPLPLPEGSRPSEERRELPEIAPPKGSGEPVVERVLPPIPPSRLPLGPPGAGGVLVRGFRFSGNTVFEDAELQSVVAAWTGRRLAARDLASARDALTLHYAEAGYVTSGARLPDQRLDDGIVRVELVEGGLSGVETSGNHWLRDAWFEARLRGGDAPLHVPSLERRLRVLQQDPRLAAVHATLRPALRQGEAVLELRVRELRPYGVGFDLDNATPPSLSDVRGRVRVWHRSLLRRADDLVLEVGILEAGPSVGGDYRLPVWRHDTAVLLGARYSESRLVDEIGSELGIETRFYEVDVGLEQPLYRSPTTTVALALTASLRDSEVSFLEGLPFPVPGSADGDVRVAPLRVLLDGVWRTSGQVLAARSLASFGLDVLGATRNPPGVPDGRFVSWLGQVQWLRRIDPWGIEVLLRSDVQLADQPLLSIEQVSVGGLASVRGYRENQLVRDQGVVGSLELRVPLWRAADDRVIAQLAPFVDAGHGWSRGGGAEEDGTLVGMGVGLRVRPTRSVGMALYWGQDLREVSTPGSAVQDLGLHFRITAETP